MSKFTNGIATGDAFCNRVKERKHLSSLIKQGRHCWLQGDRRLGKTSLIYQTAYDLKKEGIDSVVADCAVISSPEDFRLTIIENCAALAGRIPKGKGAKAKDFLLQVFSDLDPAVSLGTSGFNIKLSKTSSRQSMAQALTALDKVAQEYDVRMVFALDEFQQLFRIDTSRTIEASLRSGAQLSQNVSYIFSGSSRTLLQQAFVDSDRPLYRLCDHVMLDRISAEDWIPFIQQAAIERWGKPLADDTVRFIMAATERHTYHTSRLCMALLSNPTVPAVEDAKREWWNMIRNVSCSLFGGINSLSRNEKRVLMWLAGQPLGVFTKKASIDLSDMEDNDLRSALQSLQVSGLIRRDSNGAYRVHDPDLKGYLRVAMSEHRELLMCFPQPDDYQMVDIALDQPESSFDPVM